MSQLATMVAAIFYHRQNANEAVEFKARVGLEKAPNGTPLVATLTDGGLFSGADDVDSQTGVLFLDLAMSASRRNFIIETHKTVLAHRDGGFEVHNILRGPGGNFIFDEGYADASSTPADPHANSSSGDGAKTGGGGTDSKREPPPAVRRGGSRHRGAAAAGAAED